MAGRLRQAGIAPRERVAIAMERSLSSVVAILRVMAAGACPCPLEPRLTRQEILGRLETARIGTVLDDAAHLDPVSSISGLPTLDADHLAASPPCLDAGTSPLPPHD